MRIAIVKLSSLGDVIHALPVVHALRRRFHDAELTWVAEAREAPLLAGHPDLDRVLIVDTRRWRRLIRTRSGAGQVRREVGRLVGDLRAARFDVALDLQGLIKSGLLTASTRAPVRVGFALRHLREPLNALFTNRRVSPPPEAVHVVEQYLALLAPLGITDRQAVFNVPVSGEAERRVGAFLAEEGVKPDDRLVALNPGAGRPEKRWPVEHWQRLADRLALEGGVRLVIPWGPGEEGLAEALSRGLPVRPVAVPPTTLHELAALLRRVALVVAADTGPLHLAAALGTACLGLYGPTSAARNGPYGARCRVLESPGRVMATLQPGAVFRAILELLATSGFAHGDGVARGPGGVA
ncbi:MAG: lipopolysaccharide heptosyltransferase I [Candidatus Rokubacteria bacterium]|nr:lipopolysaccharide heptosyltransferase I [Candidatus Rokubacteria bacterium]